MAVTETSREALACFKPAHDSFVGIDSDGCIFDTMEVKQKKCFHPVIIAHWQLEPIEQYVRETAEFVNLYSNCRGTNRFPALLRTFDLLRSRPEVIKSGVSVPMLDSLRNWIGSTTLLGNSELLKAARASGDPELDSVHAWSIKVNRMIRETMPPVPPFKWALRGLREIREKSDAMCVSQTPSEALLREWKQHNITEYVAFIAGQELGTKAEHIAMTTSGRYEPSRILMIGDAPGDLDAARKNNILFYPINPGREEESWQKFAEEAYDRFLKGRFDGPYQNSLICDFEKLLPELPPWR